MQQLLIPTDFSQNAWNAAQYALRFFKNEKITIHFLHINISFPQRSHKNLHYSGVSMQQEIPERLNSEMDDWMIKVHANYPNPQHTFKHTIIQAAFVEGIRAFVHKMQVDFIVMGTKGASGLKEMTLGSKSGAVITRVKCPILVIPEKACFKRPLTIGFPTDFNIGYKHKVTNTLEYISKMCHSSIKVLRVAQTQKPLDNFQNNNRNVLKERLSDIPHSFHVIEHPNLENALQSFVTTMQIDMVAMIAKNLNFFQRILFKPQVARINYHIHIPFLVLHE